MNTIRDPIHGIIKFSNPIKNIINSPYMQRLRRCSQLSSVDQVFPNAVHNRFAHSLGVMYLARKYMKSLLVGYYGNLEPEHLRYIVMAEIAGLCHDIGHGPYSHSFDLAVYADKYSPQVNSHWPDGGHDIHRKSIITQPEFSALITACGVTAEEICQVWDAQNPKSIYFLIYTIVGGPLGADRMDFVMRDAYFCGTTHLGTIAHDRIMSKTILCVDEGNGYSLLYKTSCLNDIIHALDTRRYMYNDVYFHDIAIASSILIHIFLTHAAKEIDLLSMCEPDKFVNLDEQTLAGYILSLPDDSVAKRAYMRFRNRILPVVTSSYVEKIGPGSAPSGVVIGAPDVSGASATFISRPFTGIDPKKFDYYNIMFIDKSGKFYRCSEILEKIGFTPTPAYRKIVVVRL